MHSSQPLEAVYKQHPASPLTPDMRSSEGGVVKHDLPMAIAVPIDSPDASQRLPTRSQVRSSSNNNNQRHHWLLTWALQIPTLLVFHMLNFILALTAFILVVTLGSLSVGLLPLCCLGVLVFQLLGGFTQCVAVLDVVLANMVTPVTESASSGEKLRVHQGITSGFTALNNDGIVTRLTFISPRTIGAMVYLVTVKFVVGILSCTVVALAVGSPINAIEFTSESSKAQFVGLTYDDQPVAYVLVTVAMMVIGFVLLPVVATLSWRLTKAVCAEKTLNDEGQV